jgi:ABC-type uncharacterized transport system substrate-binding protein
VGTDKDVVIDADFLAKGRMDEVRPYIKGLVAGLANRGRKLGSDFVIDYRERAPNALEQAIGGLREAHLIFPMSTSALQAAMKAARDKPMVFPSISDHAADGCPHGGNATGVNSMRTQSVGTCLEKFKATVPSLRTIYGLHKPGYAPVTRADANLKAAAQKAQVAYTPSTVTSLQDIVAAINGIPARDPARPADVGIQVLPDDLCLGSAPTIIDLASRRGLPTFFPVTDWVKPALPSALGGYGIPQYACGEMAADYVDKILWGGAQPHQLPVIQGTGFDWVVSANAARALNIEIPSDVRAQAKVV